jgi:tetratricopeptide (TPR) repeat protein
MYAGAAYVIIELVNNVLDPLNLPVWVPRMLILVLIIGFPVIAILSWIFDLTSEGIKKTEPVSEPEQSSETGKKRRRLQVSDVIIAVLLLVIGILVYPKIFQPTGAGSTPAKGEDGKYSIAVMPFKNLTADTSFTLWQEGLQNLLITALSNSDELSVRQYETMSGMVNGKAGINYASLTPALASDIAQKLEANTVIMGNMHRFGSYLRITVNLVNTENDEVFKSYEVDGNREDDFFGIIDSIAYQIKSYLEIRNLNEQVFFDLRNAFTESTEAYKLYIQAYGFHGRLDYPAAIDLYLKAIGLDTNFVSAMNKLAYCYGDIGETELSREFAYRAYRKLDQVPVDVQLTIREVKAAVDKEPQEQIRVLKQYIERYPYCTNKWYGLGWVYFNTEQWKSSIEALERNLELMHQFETKSWVWTYILLGRAHHFEGNHEREAEVFEEGLAMWPDSKGQFDFWKAICAVSLNDTATASSIMNEIRDMAENNGWPEATILLWYAAIYNQSGLTGVAETYYRKALNLYPDNEEILNESALFLITHTQDSAEGLSLAERALDMDPDNPQYLYIYGVALSKLGEYEQAMEILTRSWELRSYYDHEHYLQLRKVEELLRGGA